MKKYKILLFSIFILFCSSYSIAQNSLDLAKNHIFKSHPHLKNQSDLDWIVTDESISKKIQITHLYLRQTYKGIEISNQNLNVTIRNAEVISVKGDFLKKVSSQSLKSKVDKLSAEDAISTFAQIQGLGSPNLSIDKNIGGISKEVVFKKNNISLEAIPAKLVYYLKDNKELHLSWDFSIAEKNKPHWWSVRMNAETGEILEQTDWTTHCSFPNHVHSEDCNHQGNITWGTKIFKPQKSQNDGSAYNVYAEPVESPNHGERTIKSEPADNVASPFGWHDTDGTTGAEYTITRGNNVYAYEDANADNAPGFSPDGGSDLQFDFPIDLGLSPNSYQEAIITNLFYWNNYIHDVFYHYGFDEASGNFQENNYGNGGVESDEVRAEAIDGSGTNNANFATPPDGNSGRMQMFVWTVGSSTTTSLSVDSPISISGDYTAIAANFGPSIISTPISAEVVLVDDGSANPSQGCNAINNDLTGKIALIDRGNCSFVNKVQNAQDAGALAVIMVNNVSDPIFAMGGSSSTITIPSVMISQADGDIIKAELGNTVEATLDLSGTPDRTSDLDNGIVAHEYGHGISIRLTGGASNSNCLNNAEQMGEGWSDYFALITTMKETDTGDMPRGIGTYAAFQPTTGGGIRPAPYTTNMGINGFTYANVDEVSVPHGVGFIWCTTLWDMTWLFIDRYGFDPNLHTGTGGNNIALELVMEGLKLQPCNPGFVDGRDAILEADIMLNGGANQDIIWQAFAGRGLGFGANQGSSGGLGDETISFDLPDAINITKTTDKNTADRGEIITYSITVRNVLEDNIDNIVVTDDLPGGLVYVEGSASNGGTESGGTITFPAFSLALNEEITLTFQALVNTATVSSLEFNDDHESGSTNWTISNTGGVDWVLTENSSEAYSGDFFWFADNVGFTTEVILASNNNITLETSATLVVKHKFGLEATYDGGVIEVSTDNGSSWTDLGDNMTLNGYNGQISPSDGSAIAGQNAFTGSFNDYTETRIDLSDFGGENVRFRFRLVTDGFVAADGWYIDDVKLYNGDLISITNEACANVEGEEFCGDINTIIEGDGSGCLAFAGTLTSTSDLSVALCNDESIDFDTNFFGIEPPAEDYEYNYIITEMNPPYNISTEVSPTENGTFDFSTLSEGNYRVWGLSYSKSNTLSTIDSYLATKTTMQSIQDDISGGIVCARLANQAFILETCTGIEQISQSRFINIYPNPSTDFLNVLIKEQSQKNAQIQITNVQGKEVLDTQFKIQKSEFLEQLDLSKLSNGLYFIRVSIDSQSYLGRIIIQK